MASSDSSCNIIHSLPGDLAQASEASVHLDSVLAISSEISAVEYLKMHFKPSYQLRRFKNKGVLLVLVLNFLTTCVYYYLSGSAQESHNHCRVCFKFILVPLGLVLTFSGWLADVRFGRYNVIYWSSLMMWLSSVLLVISLIITRVVKWHANFLHIVFLVCLGIAYGGFQGSIIQFGIDQLIDASSDEIVAYINWHSWSYVSSGAIEAIEVFASECISQEHKILTPFLLCLGLSILIVLLFLCNTVLIKEPVTQNLFRLIHNVLKYASKFKHPRLRSAFTYCEDDPPSRIDFGKSKYGGPFTTEQVEDVKTLFKLLGIVIIAGACFGISDDETFMRHTLEVFGSQVHISECYSQYFFTKTYYITIALLIPFNEFIIHPLFHRCLPKISCYWKVFLGIVIHPGKYIILMILLTKARQLTNNSPAHVTIQCIFYDNPASVISNTLDYRLFAIPEVISAISFVLFTVGSIEVLCAQVPYSMKGLVIGVFYGSWVLFFFINNMMVQIFIWKSHLWKTKSIFNCGFWYLQIKLIVNLIVFFISLLVMVYYKKRKRDDVLPNEQIFAERYYSQ